MARNKSGKVKCRVCKIWHDLPTYLRHVCFSQTTPTGTQPFLNGCNKNNDLQCSFCGLQMANPKVLEIHLTSCRHRNISKTCKLCRIPIQNQNRDQQYCVNCSVTQDYDLRFKATEGGSDKSSRTVNCADAKNSLSYSKKRMAVMSCPQKQKKVKLRMKDPKHQIIEKQPQLVNRKVPNASDWFIEKQIQVGVKQSPEIHQPSDKLCKRSGKNTVQQKKDFKMTNAESSSEKTSNSQKDYLKISRQTEKKIRQTSKKSDYLPGKSNMVHKVVTLQSLLNSIPKNDCGMLLQSSSVNRSDCFYKCCRCGKRFRSIKLGSMHYSNCNATNFLSNVVDVNDIRWVCTICDSSFLNVPKLENHLKGCNILSRKYERACERCEKCYFRCISSHVFQNHDCAKELEKMKACAVQLNDVKLSSVAGRVIMHECEFCSEIFDEQFTEQHFNSHHPGQRSSGNFKQYYVNLNPGPSCDTVVVKTEPVSPVHEFVSSVPCSFEELGYFSHVDSNPVLDQMNMPPPSSNFPVQSSQSLSNCQLPSGEPSSSRHSASESSRVINQQICKCINLKTNDDTKPCLKCLGKLDTTKFLKNLKVVPFTLAKIKQETSECSETLNSKTQTDGSMATSSTQNANETDYEHRLAYSDLFDGGINSLLTPPSSHNGISPPSTPTAMPQSEPALTHTEPYSNADVSIGSMNNEDMSIVNELNLPAFIDYINNDSSPVIPLSQCDDDQQLFIAMESPEIMHLWDVDNLDTVDAWAVVPSEGDETINKYICSTCICFSCKDQSSIIRHLCENHTKKVPFLAMYIVQTVNGSSNLTK